MLTILTPACSSYTGIQGQDPGQGEEEGQEDGGLKKDATAIERLLSFSLINVSLFCQIK